ncbi:MAG TPA: hypothetical protein VKA57_09050 [Solirubrobacteraceae bacterium]|nr:hypothetical protein [Solirubrobacteraceae bacterium]
MGYRLLGIVVWKGAKWFLRRKYGAAIAPKPLLAGGVVLALIGAALAARQRGAIEA